MSPLMATVIAERGRGWTGIIEPNVSFIVVENGRITDVVYSESNGPVQPSKYEDAPVLIVPRQSVGYFNEPAGGYTGPVTRSDDLEWSCTGPSDGPTGPIPPSRSSRTLRGENPKYRKFT